MQETKQTFIDHYGENVDIVDSPDGKDTCFIIKYPHEIVVGRTGITRDIYDMHVYYIFSNGLPGIGLKGVCTTFDVETGLHGYHHSHLATQKPYKSINNNGKVNLTANNFCLGNSFSVMQKGMKQVQDAYIEKDLNRFVILETFLFTLDQFIRTESSDGGTPYIYVKNLVPENLTSRFKSRFNEDSFREMLLYMKSVGFLDKFNVELSGNKFVYGSNQEVEELFINTHLLNDDLKTLNTQLLVDNDVHANDAKSLCYVKPDGGHPFNFFKRTKLDSDTVRDCMAYNDTEITLSYIPSYVKSEFKGEPLKLNIFNSNSDTDDTVYKLKKCFHPQFKEYFEQEINRFSLFYFRNPKRT